MAHSSTRARIHSRSDRRLKNRRTGSGTGSPDSCSANTARSARRAMDRAKSRPARASAPSAPGRAPRSRGGGKRVRLSAFPRAHHRGLDPRGRVRVSGAAAECRVLPNPASGHHEQGPAGHFKYRRTSSAHWLYCQSWRSFDFTATRQNSRVLSAPGGSSASTLQPSNHPITNPNACSILRERSREAPRSSFQLKDFRGLEDSVEAFTGVRLIKIPSPATKKCLFALR